MVSHGRYVMFQIAEVAVPRQMFQDILRLIARLRARPGRYLVTAGAADHRVTSTVQLGWYGLLIVTGNNTVCPAAPGLGVAVGTGDGVYTAAVGAGAETAVGAGAGEASGTGAVAAGMGVGTGG